MTSIIHDLIMVNDMIVFVGLFTLPKLYLLNKEQADKFLGKANKQFQSNMAKLVDRIRGNIFNH